jgi:glycosyltransferase involved in cell wall biosynthesis
VRIGIDARKIADFGIGTYIRGLLGALVELGGDEQYVAFAPANAPLPPGVEHVVVDAPHYSLRELVVMGRAAKAARLDLYHAPHYVVPFTGDLPVVVTIHDLIHLHQPQRNPFARLYAGAMLRRAVRKARAVLTVSESVRRELERELGAQKVFVTPNGIDPLFTAEGPRAEGSYFLYAGNDKPHKNVLALVEAFARVRAALPEVTLVLTGAPFVRFAEREGVITPGFVANGELAALYRGALALVLPSAEEGFGLPAVEAMACGAAVITSRAAALVEVTGDAAVHVAPEPDALAAAMLEAARASSRSAKGRLRAAQFTWKRCAEETRHAYRSSV